MDTKEDDDLKLLRATASLLADLEELLAQLTHRPKNGSNQVPRQVREMDMYKIMGLVISNSLIYVNSH